MSICLLAVDIALWILRVLDLTVVVCKQIASLQLCRSLVGKLKVTEDEDKRIETYSSKKKKIIWRRISKSWMLCVLILNWFELVS